MALFDAFLKIEGIDGESTDDKFSGWIQIESFSWGESNAHTVSSATKGAGSGKVDMQDLHITKTTDSSSPTLFLDCANGTHYGSITLKCREAGGNQIEFLTYELGQPLFCSSFQMSGSQGMNRPSESLTISYGTIKMTYQAQSSADGSAQAPVVNGWDVTKNKKM
jgi:type VI secretion system secreted protein Hcp